MTAFEWATVLIGSVSVLALALQLHLLRATHHTDNERRRKQCTIEFLSSINQRYRPIYRRIQHQFGDRPVDPATLSEEDREEIRELLSTVEHLSVGIHSEVYDFQTLRRMSSRYFIRMYDKLVPYIEDVRAKAGPGSHTIYCEFEELYQMMRDASQRKVPIR